MLRMLKSGFEASEPEAIDLDRLYIMKTAVLRGMLRMMKSHLEASEPETIDFDRFYIRKNCCPERHAQNDEIWP